MINPPAYLDELVNLFSPFEAYQQMQEAGYFEDSQYIWDKYLT